MVCVRAGPFDDHGSQDARCPSPRDGRRLSWLKHIWSRFGDGVASVTRVPASGSATVRVLEPLLCLPPVLFSPLLNSGSPASARPKASLARVFSEGSWNPDRVPFMVTNWWGGRRHVPHINSGPFVPTSQTGQGGQGPSRETGRKPGTREGHVPSGGSVRGTGLGQAGARG